MSFFKRLFAKSVPNVDLSQLDEKAENDFNEAFATLVNEQVSAKTADLYQRIESLESAKAETPQTFDASALTDKVTSLEQALEAAKAESETKVSALVAELQDIKAGTANKPKANSRIPALNVEQDKGGFVAPKLEGF